MVRWILPYCMPLALVAGAARSLEAQMSDPQPPPSGGSTSTQNCLVCHSCKNPTTASLCLRSCTRQTEMVNQLQGGGSAPDVVLLDELESLYLPVPFDHRGHAQMAEMTMGCAVCHHYTPQGAQHPACQTCHEVSPAHTDLRKPGLKGAYHRQCLNCHREWSGETQCSICHAPKSLQQPGARAAPTKDDLIGLMHPPIPEPETLAYESAYALPSHPGGSTVLFRHTEHIHRFGLRCVECHHESSCVRCHTANGSHPPQLNTPKEHHRPCVACHDTQEEPGCRRCHLAAGQVSPRFTHDQVGWPLSSFHSDIGCRSCHQQVPFKKQPTECNACHGQWDPRTFDHSKTGQMLDQNHAGIDCAECHADRTYKQPPTCVECHDQDEGISFPRRRPGPLRAGSSNSGGVQEITNVQQQPGG